MTPREALDRYTLNRQALRNGAVLRWLEPIICECVRVKYMGGRDG